MGDKGREAWEVASHASESEGNVESIECLAESDKDNSGPNGELNGNDNIEYPFESKVFHGKGPHTTHTSIGNTPNGTHNGQVLVIV